MNNARIGVDVGGTFTDLVLLDSDNHRVAYHKTPSTPDDPSQAIATGIIQLLATTNIRPEAISYLGHGTTVATNMVIEHRGANTALITTRGFRDVLEIGRQTRPSLYDYRHTKPTPLARRAHRLEVTERLAASGEILVPLQDAELATVAQRLRALGIEAVAIALLHAYRNPVHEIRIEEYLTRALPGVFICRASAVLPEFREYERTSTTCLNAFVGPRMAAYMDRLHERLQSAKLIVSPHTVQSNGGLMSVDAVKRFPVRTCLSGPAAGVVAAGAIGTAAGEPDLIAFDVGGTSTDVSLIVGGQPAITTERLVAGHAVRSPMIDVQVIGAGGGSIASIDAGGALKVGPHSAGAVPGPVAYGRGGAAPTLTDANIVLGRLNPAALLDGRMAIDATAAREAVAGQIAASLRCSVASAAAGIVAVAVANIARAIRSVSTERGHDPASLTLFAYGGAGPLHAVDVAREVECRKVLVPIAPGTLCARGILLSDLRTDLVHSLVELVCEATWAEALQQIRALAEQALAWASAEGLKASAVDLQASIDARYEGQSFEIPVHLPNFRQLDCTSFERLFHSAHEHIYGYCIPDRSIVIVNCRLRAVGQVPKAPLVAPTTALGMPTPTWREVVFAADADPKPTPIYQRAELAPGAALCGPAVIEEMSSTTILSPVDQLRVDALGNLLIEVGLDDAR